MKKKIVLLIIIILIICSVILGIILLNYNNDTQINDADKFSQEYKQVDEDNVFVYRNIDEIINILKNGTGVVYLGFPECPWCQSYVAQLNKVAKISGIEKIYYFNILEDRKNNTKKYQEIVSILKDNLLSDAEGNKKVFVPDVTYVVNGEIIAHDNETSVITDSITPEEYWTEEKQEAFRIKTEPYMDLVYGYLHACTDCNQ